MRLLHTRSDSSGLSEVLRIKSPEEVSRIRYAILSHTWEENEVVYEDILDGTIQLKSPASISKLRNACARAAADGYEYIWIDTCCIDKRNSAELSESINSMFAWYKEAAVCYAFLAHSPDALTGPESHAQLAQNRWFERGWTLQELLAPVDVHFYSGNWKKLGDKLGLSGFLADVTRIDADVLSNERPLESTSVAMRMSWAAERKTSRPEDGAYCLMGVFGVNMPMLYGEGAENAFLRLQEEIMKDSEDQSIFAWVDDNASPDARYGLLARSPRMFRFSGSILPYHQDWEPKEPYAMTNRGLRIDLHLTPASSGPTQSHYGANTIFVAAIDCPVPPEYKDSSFLGIYLEKLPGSGEQYARVRVGQLGSLRQRGTVNRIFVRQKPDGAAQNFGAFPHHYVQLGLGPDPDAYSVIRVIRGGWRGDAERPPARTLPSRHSARIWVPQSYDVTFPLPKGAARVAVAIMFERVTTEGMTGERLVVLLGSGKGVDFASDCFQVSSQSTAGILSWAEGENVGGGRVLREPLPGDIEYLERKFEPSTKGQHEVLYHSVRVRATPVAHVQTQAKYYIADIEIKAKKWHMAERSNRELKKKPQLQAPGSQGVASRRISPTTSHLPRAVE